MITIHLLRSSNLAHLTNTLQLKLLKINICSCLRNKVLEDYETKTANITIPPSTILEVKHLPRIT